ncbi:transcription factor bHLH113-like [Musa acuminata AAA Group]|uniref:transcription factor bHLH113-like n=1 Tax=Musa acuminata AAA Group TaxID=214697 RepID=UPI0031D4A53C
MWNDAVLPSLSSPFSSSLGNTGPPWLQSSDDSTELQRVNCGGLLGALQEKSDGGSLTGSLRRFVGMSNVTGKGDPMMTTGCSAAGIHPKVVAERRKRTISRDPANKNQTPSSPSSKNPKTMCSKTMARMPLIKAPARRSQKLGDKITALQQLVSPFGKADTASVLHEAALSIKFLHEQIEMLTAPYFVMRSPEEGDEGLADSNAELQSRGLCLVPVFAMVELLDQEDYGLNFY